MSNATDPLAMSDVNLVMQDYPKLQEENAMLLKSLREARVKIKKMECDCIKERGEMQIKIDDLEDLVHDQADKMAKLLFMMEAYKNKIEEIDPGFTLPEHVMKFAVH